MSSEDIVPRDAIEFHLETYDAESQLFHGILKIDSPIVPTDALIHFPMKRADARVFWGNRQSLIPRVRVSLALWSLSTDLNRFGLDDPESGMTARVFVVPRPPAGQPPSGKAGVVSGFKESARALAERAPEVTRTDSAKGVIAEYNRLIGEAKGVFVSDAFVQSLREIAYHGSVWQSAGEVATAAGGLHAYLTSFASSDGFKESARALAERAPEVTRTDSAKGVIAEYNRLIGEAKGVFVSDAFVQSLREIAYHGSVWQSAGEVATAAGGLHAYLTSFASSDGFKESARALAERAPEVTRTDSAKGVIAEYNRLIGEAKGVFVSDASVQGLREIRYQGNVRQAAEAVASAASSLGRIVANMSDVPITFEITEKPSRGQEFDYLPYSGRFSGNVRSLAKWLRRDFSLLLKDEYGYTDLHHAATENLPGLVSALLDAGASANVRSATNYAPLHFAATALIAADLIAGGATVNAMTDLGWTPLMVAAWKRNHAIAEFLIGQGANVNLKHGDGWTALDFALHRGASDVAELLKRHGGTCNEKC